MKRPNLAYVAFAFIWFAIGVQFPVVLSRGLDWVSLGIFVMCNLVGVFYLISCQHFERTQDDYIKALKAQIVQTEYALLNERHNHLSMCMSYAEKIGNEDWVRALHEKIDLINQEMVAKEKEG